MAQAIVQRKTRVIDLDLRSYFDGVRHDVLLAKVAKRGKDDDIMHLLKMVLKATGTKGVPQGGVITSLTQKVILAAWGLGPPVLGQSCRNRNAVTNGDGILADQNFFHQQSHDFLALKDTKSFRSTAQTGKECCESFC